MFNHMRYTCAAVGRRAAPRPSSVLPSVPPDRRAPGLQPGPGPQGRGGIRGRLPAWPPEGPGVCKARVPAGRPALRPRSRIIEAHLLFSLERSGRSGLAAPSLRVVAARSPLSRSPRELSPDECSQRAHTAHARILTPREPFAAAPAALELLGHATKSFLSFNPSPSPLCCPKSREARTFPRSAARSRTVEPHEDPRRQPQPSGRRSAGRGSD